MSCAEDIPVAALHDAARRPEVVAAMRAFYAALDGSVGQQGATCWNKGDCCRFGQFGHRLYVTALEVAYYLANGGPPPAAETDACPHARQGRCQVRDRRFLGCRVFYCDPTAQHWQGPLTEEFLARLRALHEELGVPYFYADWMAVVRALRAEERGERG